MNQSLFPIIQSNKYGYINQFGEIIIKPTFDVGKRFSEGLARVKIDGKWGFIDETGKFVIKPFYELNTSTDDNLRHLDFHEGKASFAASEGKFKKKWGFLDKNGDIVVSPVWDNVSEFSSGIARVIKNIIVEKGRFKTHTSKGFYIDQNGQVLDFTIIGSAFFEGLAHFLIGINDDWTKTSEIKNLRTGYIDTNGNIAIETEPMNLGDFSEGLAIFHKKETCGYIDKIGNFVCEMNFKGGGDFHEGLARVTVGYRKINDEIFGVSPNSGFINQIGKIIIEPKFFAVGNFSDEVAAAAIYERISDKQGFWEALRCGFIDKSGNWVIEPRFTFVCGDFENELALVSECDEWNSNGFPEKSKWGYINKTGKYVWISEEDFYTEKEKSNFAGFSVFRDYKDKISNYPAGFELNFFSFC